LTPSPAGAAAVAKVKAAASVFFAETTFRELGHTGT